MTRELRVGGEEGADQVQLDLALAAAAADRRAVLATPGAEGGGHGRQHAQVAEIHVEHRRLHRLGLRNLRLLLLGVGRANAGAAVEHVRDVVGLDAEEAGLQDAAAQQEGVKVLVVGPGQIGVVQRPEQALGVDEPVAPGEQGAAQQRGASDGAQHARSDLLSRQDVPHRARRGAHNDAAGEHFLHDVQRAELRGCRVRAAPVPSQREAVVELGVVLGQGLERPAEARFLEYAAEGLHVDVAADGTRGDRFNNERRAQTKPLLHRPAPQGSRERAAKGRVQAVLGLVDVAEERLQVGLPVRQVFADLLGVALTRRGGPRPLRVARLGVALRAQRLRRGLVGVRDVVAQVGRAVGVVHVLVAFQQRRIALAQQPADVSAVQVVAAQPRQPHERRGLEGQVVDDGRQGGGAGRVGDVRQVLLQVRVRDALVVRQPLAVALVEVVDKLQPLLAEAVEGAVGSRRRRQAAQVKLLLLRGGSCGSAPGDVLVQGQQPGGLQQHSDVAPQQLGHMPLRHPALDNQGHGGGGGQDVRRVAHCGPHGCDHCRLLPRVLERARVRVPVKGDPGGLPELVPLHCAVRHLGLQLLGQRLREASGPRGEVSHILGRIGGVVRCGGTALGEFGDSHPDHGHGHDWGAREYLRRHARVGDLAVRNRLHTNGRGRQRNVAATAGGGQAVGVPEMDLLQLVARAWHGDVHNLNRGVLGTRVFCHYPRTRVPYDHAASVHGNRSLSVSDQYRLHGAARARRLHDTGAGGRRRAREQHRGHDGALAGHGRRLRPRVRAADHFFLKRRGHGHLGVRGADGGGHRGRVEAPGWLLAACLVAGIAVFPRGPVEQVVQRRVRRVAVAQRVRPERERRGGERRVGHGGIEAGPVGGVFEDVGLQEPHHDDRDHGEAPSGDGGTSGAQEHLVHDHNGHVLDEVLAEQVPVADHRNRLKHVGREQQREIVVGAHITGAGAGAGAGLAGVAVLHFGGTQKVSRRLFGAVVLKSRTPRLALAAHRVTTHVRGDLDGAGLLNDNGAVVQLGRARRVGAGKGADRHATTDALAVDPDAVANSSGVAVVHVSQIRVLHFGAVLRRLPRGRAAAEVQDRLQQQVVRGEAADGEEPLVRVVEAAVLGAQVGRDVAGAHE
ncbi:phosphoribosylamine-glycine ligase [Babesia caballi]|uniref:Phosphoribosylamine-glycine ligase n=1 Tax=Babesia caballi TaxID=5871 RepID=A0AAV4LMG1_BABCB|nr:phosphoribosylamine-glycine ligase [Babesia caballi]